MKWKRVYLQASGCDYAHFTRGQVTLVTSPLVERLRGARCNQNYANTMQIPAHRDANPRHNIGGNWPTAFCRNFSFLPPLSLYLFSFLFPPFVTYSNPNARKFILEEVTRSDASQRFHLFLYIYVHIYLRDKTGSCNFSFTCNKIETFCLSKTESYIPKSNLKIKSYI